MSTIKWNPPIHLPLVTKYQILGSELRRKYEDRGVSLPFPMQYATYFHPDTAGWAKIIQYLTLKSSLYKPDVRTCSWYSFKAYVLCNELFEFNTLAPTQGNMPLGRHAWNSFFDGDAIWLFEPNEGFEDERGIWQDLWGTLDGDIVFPWGENGYIPDVVLL